jgi:hypothetical protein
MSDSREFIDRHTTLIPTHGPIKYEYIIPLKTASKETLFEDDKGRGRVAFK